MCLEIQLYLNLLNQEPTIPMDGCHLFLERPWMYDRHAIFDGHANIYSLMKTIVHHKLKPLVKEDEKVCSSARV